MAEKQDGRRRGRLQLGLAAGAAIAAIAVAVFLAQTDRDETPTPTVPPQSVPPSATASEATEPSLVESIRLRSRGDDFVAADVAWDPKRGRAYVAARRREQTSKGQVYHSVLFVVDGRTRAVIRTIPLPGDHLAYRVAADPERGRIYVETLATPGEDRLWILDAESHSVVASMRLAFRLLGGPVVDPVNHRLYAAEESVVGVREGAVVEIDPVARKITRRIVLSAAPGDLALDGHRTLHVIATRSVGQPGPGGQTETESLLIRVEAPSGRIVGQAALEAERPTTVAVSDDGDRAYISKHGSSEALEVIDTDTGSSSELGVGARWPDGLLIDSGRDLLLVAVNGIPEGDEPVAGPGAVVVYRRSSGRELGRVVVGVGTARVAFDAASGRAYAADSREPFVHVIQV